MIVQVDARVTHARYENPFTGTIHSYPSQYAMAARFLRHLKDRQNDSTKRSRAKRRKHQQHYTPITMRREILFKLRSRPPC